VAPPGAVAHHPDLKEGTRMSTSDSISPPTRDGRFAKALRLQPGRLLD